jgi:hypothetical protein
MSHEHGEERSRKFSAADTPEDPLDEAAPEDPLASLASPALLAGLAARRDLAPGRPDRLTDRTLVRGNSVVCERTRVDVLDGRVAGQERVTGVEEDGVNQGITCPPSMTID